MSVTSAQIENSIPKIINELARSPSGSMHAGSCIASYPAAKVKIPKRNISPPLINSKIDEILRIFLLSDISIFRSSAS